MTVTAARNSGSTNAHSTVKLAFFSLLKGRGTGTLFQDDRLCFSGETNLPGISKSFSFLLCYFSTLSLQFFPCRSFRPASSTILCNAPQVPEKHPCASFLITIFPCNGKHLSGIGLHIRRCFQCGYASIQAERFPAGTCPHYQLHHIHSPHFFIFPVHRQ